MLARLSQKRGFTLVELLIVIVVIAILAGLSIVTYNGLQQRAENSAIMANSSSIIKQIEVYKAAHDSYPESITVCPTSGADELCLDMADNIDMSYTKTAAGGSGTLTISATRTR